MIPFRYSELLDPYFASIGPINNLREIPFEHM